MSDEVKMLQQRIQILEAMLAQATDLLDDMITNANVHNICDQLAVAEEFVGEFRAVLEE